MQRLTIINIAVACLLASGMAVAQVSDGNAADLGSALTPLGAKRAGNAAGTIPAWSGGLVNPPPDYVAGKQLPNPYASEKPLFTITADNVAQYKDDLSPGQIALIKQRKGLKFKVYPSHRSAGFPQRVYDAVEYNAHHAKLSPNGEGVQHSRVTSPFPVPESGLQAIWNHLLRFRGVGQSYTEYGVTTTASGDYVPVVSHTEQYFPYAAKSTKAADKGVLYKRRAHVTQPPRLAGTMALVINPVSFVDNERVAYRYNPGQRRVRAAPRLAFDAILPGSDGQLTVDQAGGYAGDPGRYNWTLKGKQELFIPYNSYELHLASDVITNNYLNPEHTRYELHRVWVVEANIKPKWTHLYPKRVFYIDEDSWQIAVVDMYDKRGKLWRVQQVHPVQHYQIPVFYGKISTSQDLNNQRLTVSGLDNTNGTTPIDFHVKFKPDTFTVGGLRQLGFR